MVKKLMKYEFMYYLRSIAPMCIILLGMALANRLIQFAEKDSTTYNILFTSSAILLGIMCFVVIAMAFILGVVRFHKNMYSEEGYLSLVLPVTENQHIFAKVLCALIETVVAFIWVLISLSIATAGDVWVELMKAFFFLMKKGSEVAGATNFVFYVIEFVVAAVAVVVCAFLLFYACDSIGQLAKKNRVLSAFGAYLVHYVFWQIMGTIGIIWISNEYWPTEAIIELIDDHPKTFIHVFLIGITVFSLVLSAIYYAVTHWVLKKKLNLE